MFYFFSLQSIRMSGKNMNFGDKKMKKSDFYKNKKILMILMLIKYQFLKKNHAAQKEHLNTLFDIMTMMLLDHHK